MGQAKYNPTAIAAKKGEIPPKKKPMGKRELMRHLSAIVDDRINRELGFSLDSVIPPYKRMY